VARLVAVPAIEVSTKELHPRVFNVLILGAVIGLTGVITVEEAKEAIERRLGHRFEKDPALRDLNYRAVERGAELVRGLI
jgi:2-oxoglutarate ferredoxin oxidoreductase subunit gamma